MDALRHSCIFSRVDMCAQGLLLNTDTQRDLWTSLQSLEVSGSCSSSSACVGVPPPTLALVPIKVSLSWSCVGCYQHSGLRRDSMANSQRKSARCL